MTGPYDPQLAIQLAAICELTYVQYGNGPPSSNNGNITPPAGYTQIASFMAPEVEISTSLKRLSHVDWQNVKSSSDIRRQFDGIADVYFGFALTSATHNVIALRGTRSTFEWLLDASIPQVPVPLIWYQNGKFEVAKVHLGFLIIQCMLAEQIIAAANQFDSSLPCLVTGHSLGGALAVLTSPMLNLLTANQNIQMYSLACPRVGNVAFADSYEALITDSYRIVNLSDLVPMLPPTKLLDWTYEHVGVEWSFLNQTGNIAGNHALIGANNYTDAINLSIPTNANRVYPVTGLGDSF